MSTSNNKQQSIAATILLASLAVVLLLLIGSPAEAQIPPASDGTPPTYSIDDPSGYCGDGTQSVYEQCEDGNTVNGDGCSAACTLENAAPPAPTVSVVVNPTSISSGGSSVVSWSSSGATSCSGTGVSTGGATAGQVTVSPSVTTSYSVSCTGAGGTTAQSRTVTVGSAPTATALLTANPTSVSAGGTATLTWSSTNAASCSGTGFSTGGAAAGSVATALLTTGSHTYSVTCGGATASATVIAATEDCEGTSCSQVCVYVPSVQPSAAQVSSQDGRVGIGAAQIIFAFNAGIGSGPPGPPIISGPTTRGVYESGVYGFIATDPDGDTIRYLVDWNMDGVVDQILPGTGYVASNTNQSANKSWGSTGSQTFQARTEDSTGGVSSWSTYNVTVAAAAQCSDGIDNDSDGKVDYPVDTGCENAEDDTEDPDAPAGPTANLNGPASVVGGERATLTWSSTNATSCSGTGFSTGGATSGSVQTSELTSPPSSYSYRVACTGPGGTAMDIHTVGITGAGINIMAAPTRVKKGTETSLTWSASQVASCTVTGTNGFSAVGLTGTNVSSGAIQSQTTFTLSCDNGAVSDSVIVDVLPVIDEV